VDPRKGCADHALEVCGGELYGEATLASGDEDAGVVCGTGINHCRERSTRSERRNATKNVSRDALHGGGIRECGALCAERLRNQFH
jgi:hypothetical protein